MKHFIILAALLLGFIPAAFADAGIGIFGAAVDEDHPGKDYAPVGLVFDALAGDKFQIGGELFYFGNGAGGAITAGAKLTDWRFLAGLGKYDDHITDQVNVAGVDVETSGSEIGDLYFLEASYKKLFVRASQVDTDFDLIGRRQTGTDINGNPIFSYANKSVSTSDRWLWIGVRFGFE